eukprot:gnl/MRDRNA2_/MRDRNA2_24621_c0_seq1.p1 gnl/MRDRNA2_/MRDRNA2_24621_c0~~gnl/MRDRNA2_/MRDRNA2_24621_c0_seq1.p1  ORF type:complete len:293 (+),score=34.70 gnl/MRDRNA2_/MRDRNA2_24621_c0_seq1:190-1068(+)
MSLMLIEDRGENVGEPVSGSLPSDSLTDIDGRPLDLKELTKGHVTIVCTMKCPDCPICPEQVRRLLREPLRSYFAESGVYFIIICPGTNEELQTIRTGLREFVQELQYMVSFVCDEDHSIGAAIHANILLFRRLVLMPCFFEVTRSLEVGWKQVGRGPDLFGESMVLAFVAKRRREADRKLAFLQPEVRSLLDVLEHRVMGRIVDSMAPSRLLFSQEIVEDVLQRLQPKTRRSVALVCREWHWILAHVSCVEAKLALAEGTIGSGVADVENKVSSLEFHCRVLQALKEGLNS